MQTSAVLPTVAISNYVVVRSYVLHVGSHSIIILSIDDNVSASPLVSVEHNIVELLVVVQFDVKSHRSAEASDKNQNMTGQTIYNKLFHEFNMEYGNFTKASLKSC